MPLPTHTHTRTPTRTRLQGDEIMIAHKENLSLLLLMTQVTVIPLRFRFEPRTCPTPVFFLLPLLFLPCAQSRGTMTDPMCTHQHTESIRAHAPQDHHLSSPALRGKQLTCGAVDDARANARVTKTKTKTKNAATCRDTWPKLRAEMAESSACKREHKHTNAF